MLGPMVYGGAGVLYRMPCFCGSHVLIWAALEGKGISNPNDSKKTQTYLEHTATRLPETLNQQP